MILPNKLLKVVVFSLLTLTAVYIYWSLQPVLYVKAFPVVVKVSKPGGYVLAAMPKVRIKNSN